MDWNALLAPAVRYTGLAAAATVGVAYVAFSTGLTLVLLAGTGVLLVVLGAGEAGAAPASGVGMAEDSGMEAATEGMDGVDMLPGSSAHLSLRAKLLFYGLGLVLWNVAGLAVLLR